MSTTTTTKYQPLYWNSEGKHQARYDELQALLVPTEGMAKTATGEMLRLASNVYYDVYNNGGGNIGSRGSYTWDGSRASQALTLCDMLESCERPASVDLRCVLEDAIYEGDAHESEALAICLDNLIDWIVERADAELSAEGAG